MNLSEKKQDLQHGIHTHRHTHKKKKKEKVERLDRLETKKQK